MKYTLIGLLILYPLSSFSDTFTDFMPVQSKFSQKNKKIISHIMWAADVAEIPRELLLTTCYGESNLKTKGVTHLDGNTVSHSICQVKLETAQFLDRYYKHKNKATPESLENPKINAFYAAKMLKYQLDRYDDNWKLAVDAYNKGTAVSEKSVYVKRFIKNLAFIRSFVNAESRYSGSAIKTLR